MTTNQIHVYLSPESAKFLKKKAKQERRSVSAQCVVIIEKAMREEKEQPRDQ